MASLSETIAKWDAPRGSSVSTAAPSDDWCLESCGGSSVDVSDASHLTGSLIELTADNRRRSKQLRLWLSMRSAFWGRRNEQDDAKATVLVSERDSRARIRPAASIEENPLFRESSTSSCSSIADLRVSNELRSAELSYLMSSRRLQTLQDVGLLDPVVSSASGHLAERQHADGACLPVGSSVDESSESRGACPQSDRQLAPPSTIVRPALDAKQLSAPDRCTARRGCRGGA